MGLAKSGRFVISISLLALTVIPGATGCSKSKNANISSQSFMAPQAVSVDPDTGMNSQGVRAVEVVAEKLDMLHEVHRDPVTGQVTELDATLRQANALLNVVGKLDDLKLLLFESESKTLLTIDLDKKTNAVAKVMEKEEFLDLFHNQAQKPIIGPVLRLRSGWLLCYEGFSKSLFAVRKDPDDDAKIIATLVRDQTEIQDELFPEGAKTQVTVKGMVEFDSEDQGDGSLREEVVVIPANPTMAALHRFTIVSTDRTFTGSFVLNVHVVVPDPAFPDVTKNIYEPFLDFKKIKALTSNSEIDVKDFLPTLIPDRNALLLFDRAKDTASFLAMNFRAFNDIDQGLVYDTTVEKLVNKEELLKAVQDANQGGEPFQGQFRFFSAFLHPDHNLPAKDPKRKPFIMAFDEQTNNLFAYDYTRTGDDPKKVRVFTSSTMLTSRTDLHLDPELDSGTFEPVLFWSTNEVLANKLAFDSGPGEIIAFNYDTGQVVVVLHRRDLTKVTQSGLLDAIFIEAIDPPPSGKGNELRLIDSESSSVVAIQLEYLAVPVRFPRR